MDSSVEKKSISTIKKGAIVSYTSIIFNILSRLIYTPFIIIAIGKNDFGLYSLAISLISFLVLDYGLSDTVSRYVSKFRAEGKFERIEEFLGITFKLYIFIAVIMAGVLAIMYFNLDRIYVKLSFEEIERFRIPFLIVSLYGVIIFPFIPINGILLSFEESFLLKLSGLTHKVVMVSLIFLILYLKPSLEYLILAPIIAGLVLVVLKTILFIKRIPIKVNLLYRDKHLLKEILGFTFWTAIIAFSMRLIPILSPNLIGIFSGAASIAVYSIASGIENYVFTFSQAINGMFLPIISRRVLEENGDERITLMMIRVGRFILFVLTVIYLGIVLLGNDFISLWVGSEFVEAYYILLLILIPGYFYLPQQVGNSVILAKNYVKTNAFIQLIVIFVYLVLSILLLPKLGLIGLGISVLIANSLRNILINIIYQKLCNIDIKKFFLNVHIKFLPSTIIVFIVVSLIYRFIDITGWFGFLIKGIVLVVIYVLVMWIIGLSKDEKGMFVDMVKKVFQKIFSLLKR